MTEEIITNKTILDAVSSIGARVYNLEKRFDVIDQHLEQQDLRLSSLEHLVRNLGFEMSMVKKKVEEINGRLMAVENDIKEIYFHWTFD